VRDANRCSEIVDDERVARAVWVIVPRDLSAALEVHARFDRGAGSATSARGTRRRACALCRCVQPRVNRTLNISIVTKRQEKHVLWSASTQPQRPTLFGEATMPFSGRLVYVADSEHNRGRWRD
jgi:hypothetical protein